MSFFPPDLPRPEPNFDDADFWKGCAERRLRFQACGSCGKLRHPPTPICWNCHSVEVAWVDAPEEAVVYTYNIIRHASHPAAAQALPYVGAVVVFPALAGVRFITNIVGIAPDAVRIGMPVTLQWDDIGDGMFIPRFGPPPG